MIVGATAAFAAVAPSRIRCQPPSSGRSTITNPKSPSSTDTTIIKLRRWARKAGDADDAGRPLPPSPGTQGAAVQASWWRCPP
ncbi:hypothetical protein [Kitasatospora acidiphila]|uniref:hypothetical protein n=1 Tax=Kitasatospora acidiphila TaxID=2567942 RepID=UPI0015F115C6|nr:hypothetical protein [Kitasatospora acidiphila]